MPEQNTHDSTAALVELYVRSADEKDTPRLTFCLWKTLKQGG